MLEIIAIIYLVRYNGNICKEKNVKPGWYQFLTVILWIALEFLGAIIGVVLFGEGKGGIYLSALIGAGLGAFVSIRIVKGIHPNIPIDNDQLLDNGLTLKDFR